MFGRHFKADRRDQEFLLRAKRSQRTYRFWDDTRWFGDQAETPHCVGFVWSHWLDCEPVAQYLDPHGLYELAQFLDREPGEDYDGTTVRAGAKVLHKLGLIGEYRWARTLNSVVTAVLDRGPMVVGTNWYAGMSTPGRGGLLSVSGALQGGHAYLLSGVNAQTKRLRIKQSWGPEWGDAGRAWISFDDFARLLAEDGEACLATELRPEPQ